MEDGRSDPVSQLPPQSGNCDRGEIEEEGEYRPQSEVLGGVRATISQGGERNCTRGEGRGDWGGIEGETGEGVLLEMRPYPGEVRE